MWKLLAADDVRRSLLSPRAARKRNRNEDYGLSVSSSRAPPQHPHAAAATGGMAVRKLLCDAQGPCRYWRLNQTLRVQSCASELSLHVRVCVPATLRLESSSRLIYIRERLVPSWVATVLSNSGTRRKELQSKSAERDEALYANIQARCEGYHPMKDAQLALWQPRNRIR